MDEYSTIIEDDTDLRSIHRHNEKYLMLGYRLLKKYGSKTHTGSTRKVFFSKRHVIKMPLDSYSEHFNVNEYHLYKSGYNKDKYARCRLIKINGINVLVMEKLIIDTEIDYHLLPDWCNYLFDGRQVGYDKKGNIKIFDYAMEKIKNLA